MYIATDDMEIINFSQYQNLRVEGKPSGKGRLVLTSQDGAQRVIAEFESFYQAFDVFEDIREAIASGENYYDLEVAE